MNFQFFAGLFGITTIILFVMYRRKVEELEEAKQMLTSIKNIPPVAPPSQASMEDPADWWKHADA